MSRRVWKPSAERSLAEPGNEARRIQLGPGPSSTHPCQQRLFDLNSPPQFITFRLDSPFALRYPQYHALQPEDVRLELRPQSLSCGQWSACCEVPPRNDSCALAL